VNDADLTVDIYDMGGAERASAMYAGERPPDCRQVAVGGGGYADKGVLNFHQERYYVKLMAFRDAGDPAALLETTARAISARIGKRAGRCGAGTPACNAAFSGIRHMREVGACRIEASSNFVAQAARLAESAVEPTFRRPRRLSARQAWPPAPQSSWPRCRAISCSQDRQGG